MKLDALEEKIIYHLMMQSGPTTVAKLADLCNVSANSIRNRIPYLNRKIKDDDLQIVTKRSVGCELQKLSEQRSEENKYHDLRFDLNRSNYISKTDRINIIIRRLLCTEGFFPLQAACDMLYYSYSELHRDISYANQYLEKFHLKIINKRSKGLQIVGNEMNKRVCMAFQHKRFRYLDEESKQREPWFSSIFDSSLPINMVQQYMIKVLEDHPRYAYSHINFPKIINMVYIMKARQNHSKEIRFSDNLTQYICTAESHEIARSYLKCIAPKIGFTPLEEDVRCLTVILEAYRSIRNADDLRSIPIYEAFIRESRSLLHQISLSIFNDTVKSEESYDLFSCTLFTAWVLSLLELPLDEEINYPIQENYAISSDFSVVLYHAMKDRTGICLSPALLKYMTYSLRIALRDLGKQTSSFRMLVYSIYGAEYSRYVAANITRVYGQDFTEVDFIESIPALHKSDLEKYDLLLTDNATRNLNVIDESLKQKPMIWLPLSSYPQHYAELDEWLTDRKNAILVGVLGKRIYEISIKDADSLYKTVYEKLKKDLPLSEKEFIASLKQREEIFPTYRGNRMAFLSCDPQIAGKDLLAIFINKKTVSWSSDSKVQFFVYYNCDSADSHDRKVIMKFLKMFLRQPPTGLFDLLRMSPEEIVTAVMKENQ